MEPSERMDLVTRNAEEIITPDELRALLEVETAPKAYWGFEPSGQRSPITGARPE
jgi:tyrosyl-tRNA synthetase